MTLCFNTIEQGSETPRSGTHHQWQECLHEVSRLNQLRRRMDWTEKCANLLKRVVAVSWNRELCSKTEHESLPLLCRLADAHY